MTNAVITVVLFCVLYLIASMFLAALAHWSTASNASKWLGECRRLLLGV